YVGELVRNGNVHAGKYRLLIDRATFDACQALLNGKNRRMSTHAHLFSGGLLRCAYCGFAMTGERIRRKLRGGGVREHIYYRCANNHRGPDHPPVRWREADLEDALRADFDSMRMPEEIAAWFRTA